MELLTEYFLLPGYLTEATALAAVALLGYLFGRSAAGKTSLANNDDLAGDINRAVRIARDLQNVTDRIRQELAKHQGCISKFQSHVGSIDSNQEQEAWSELASEAEALLVPTMTVTTSLSAAYDQLRKHSAELMNFTSSRTDPETGVSNRRALEEHLDSQFVAFGLNKNRFCLAMFSVSGPEDKPLDAEEHKELRASFARLVEHSARDTDFVARYSEDEFTVVMSNTTIAGATIFSERLLRLVEVNLQCFVSGGMAEVTSEDDSEKLFSRVDSALYSARSNGGNCLYLHDGKALRRLQAVQNTPPEQCTEQASEEPTATVSASSD